MKRLRIVQDTRWEGYYYLPPSDFMYPHSINVPRGNESDMEYICIVLHEIGHAYYQHDFRDSSTPPEKIIKEELEAWDYAKRCVKSKYYKFITDIVDDRIINWRKWYKDNFYTLEELEGFENVVSEYYLNGENI